MFDHIIAFTNGVGAGTVAAVQAFGPAFQDEYRITITNRAMRRAIIDAELKAADAKRAAAKGMPKGGVTLDGEAHVVG